MTRDGGWIGRAAAAARLAADRPDWWIAGSLGALLLSWLPLVLTVAPVPTPGDLAFAGARLLSSGSFPWNVLLLAALAALAILVGCLVAALGEAAFLRSAREPGPGRSLSRDTEAAFSVVLAAGLPTFAALAALVSGVAAVAPAEFGAPDVGGPLILRIAGHLAPLLVALAVFVLVGQAVGAAALRRALGPGSMPIGASLWDGLRDLAQHPARRLGLATVGTLADLLTVGVAFALLGALWAPIAVDLADGQLVSPQALLLLVGFVAIWIALVVGFGALHSWISAWWTLELEQGNEAIRPEAQEAHP